MEMGPLVLATKSKLSFQQFIGSLRVFFQQFFKQFKAVMIIAFIKTANYLVKELLGLCVNSSELSKLTCTVVVQQAVSKTVTT